MARYWTRVLAWQHRRRMSILNFPARKMTECIITAGLQSVARPRSLVSRFLTASLLHRLESHRSEGEKPLKRLMPTRGQSTGVRPVLIRTRDRRPRMADLPPYWPAKRAMSDRQSQIGNRHSKIS